MRGWILGSVEVNASLTNKTVTGGVLQSYGAWTKMDAWCMAKEPTYADESIQWVRPVLLPNPSSGDGCMFMGSASELMELTLFDGAGRLVFSGEVMTNERVQFAEPLGAGIYHWQVKTKRGMVQMPWVIRGIS